MFVIWFLCLGSAALLSSVDAGALLGGQCPAKKPPLYLNTITNVEQLQFGIKVNTVLEKGHQKRYMIQLNNSTPLLINIVVHPQGVLTRRLYFNRTINISRYIRMNSTEMFLSCATTGQYDLVLSSRQRCSIELVATDIHPSANWTLLSRRVPIKIRSRNRMQRGQMIVKWSKSILDIHAINYCLIVNTKSPQKDFCKSVGDSINSTYVRTSCAPHNSIENIWLGKGRRIKKIDSENTNVVCTGTKIQQILSGLQPNMKYFIDVFGVHTKQRSLTFLLGSTTVWFNRTRPNPISDNALTIGKIPRMTSVATFSYKIPHKNRLVKNIRFLIIPCGGSQVNMKVMKRRQIIDSHKDIYKPMYVPISDARPGQRYTIRVNPSNEDRILRVNKIAIAATTQQQFNKFPELPTNTTVTEIRSLRYCDSTILAWQPSPETRQFQYCIIVLNYHRSPIDHTNYCMDFGKKITKTPEFYSINCFEPNTREKIAHFRLLNLTPGGSYLIYVTVNLLGGKSLPYESIKVKMNKYCHNDLEKNIAYYDNY